MQHSAYPRHTRETMHQLHHLSVGGRTLALLLTPIRCHSAGAEHIDWMDLAGFRSHESALRSLREKHRFIVLWYKQWGEESHRDTDY